MVEKRRKCRFGSALAVGARSDREKARPTERGRQRERWRMSGVGDALLRVRVSLTVESRELLWLTGSADADHSSSRSLGAAVSIVLLSDFRCIG